MHLEKEKKKEKPVSYKTKRTEVITGRSRNAHNSENSAKDCWKFKWDDKRKALKRGDFDENSKCGKNGQWLSIS